MYIKSETSSDLFLESNSKEMCNIFHARIFGEIRKSLAIRQALQNFVCDIYLGQ